MCKYWLGGAIEEEEEEEEEEAVVAPAAMQWLEGMQLRDPAWVRERESLAGRHGPMESNLGAWTDEWGRRAGGASARCLGHPTR